MSTQTNNRIDHVAEAFAGWANAINCGHPEALDNPQHESLMQLLAAIITEQRNANEQARIANLIALANMNTEGKYWADDIADLASEAFTMVTSPEVREALGI